MSNVHILNLSSYTTPVIQESKRENWVDFGEDNDFYQFLMDRYTNSTTNSAIINNVARLVYGRGLSALDASKKPNEWASLCATIDNEDIKKIIFDRKMLGQFAIQVHYNDKHDKILKAYHMPVNLVRAEKCNKEGEIEGYYYSDDWTDTKKYVPVRFPAFGTSKEKIEILFCKPYAVGMKYYAYPDYQGALPYALLEEEIADYLINEVQNGFSGSRVINFSNGVPTEEQQSVISAKVLGQLSGSRGQKTIISFNDNVESKTTIDDIPLNNAPEHYTYLSEECMRKIMLGHNVTSPLLFGVASTNGFSSNADELRNSTILYENMVIRPLQDEIIAAIDKIINFNGISLKLQFVKLNPLDSAGDLTLQGVNKGLIDAITNLSPLVANKVIETLTPNEIRSIVGLAPESGGSDLNPELLSSHIDNEIADSLIECGEEIPNNWVLIDEFEVDYDKEDEIDLEIHNANNTKKSLFQKLANVVRTGTAIPRANSEQDATVDGLKYITRYRYEGELKENSREFCKKMISANKVYRKEDIERMDEQIVNKGWGPKGADKYSIWLYKGGGACHHKWIRQTFVAYEKGRGIDPLSPNAKTISTNKAEKAGYRVRNPQQVSMRPIDMPFKGFLPTNKRFK